jgi:hypothetical protein
VEDFLKLSHRLASLAILVLLAASGTGITALQAQKPEKKQAQKVAPVPTRVWKSETSGKEFRVWKENNRFHAEWANIRPEFAAKGVYIRTVCRRSGEKWVGESRSYLPCAVGEGKNEKVVNFCHFTTGFEVDTITDSRIAGRGEAVRVSDCTKCQVRNEGWKPFVWVPLPPKKGTGHEVPESR